MGLLTTSALAMHRLCAWTALLVVLAGIAVTADLNEEAHAAAVADREMLMSVEEGAGGIDIDVDGDGKNRDGNDAPRKKMGYHSIPGFVLKHMGQENDAATVLDCEEMCDKEETCRSYSYNPKEKVCVWSIETIRYRLGWEFWSKVHELDAFGKWRHYGKYRSFPDIMYQEPGYHQYKNVNVKACQKHCNQDKKCKAFSYQPEKQRCFLADSGIHYDPNYTYYERLGMKPRKNVMDVADQQEALQNDEKNAKKAKRRRLIASIQEREDKNARTAHEMKMKGNARESRMKDGEKKHAEHRLNREKVLEKHDKRLAVLKERYNEGYFKAKGTAAEKKVKEKDIKKMRAKENDDKDKQKVQKHEMDNRKKNEEKKAKKERHAAQARLLKAKEKITKLKNDEAELEISKEERVLDIAKNLGLESSNAHAEEKENEKEKKFHHNMKEKKKIFKADTKAETAKRSAKAETNILDKLKIMTENRDYSSDKWALMGQNATASYTKAPTPAPPAKTRRRRRSKKRI